MSVPVPSTSTGRASTAEIHRNFLQNFLLPNDVILNSIQDVGKVSNKSNAREIEYPNIKKVAGKFFDEFSAKSFPNLPVNKSRTCIFIPISQSNKDINQLKLKVSLIHLIVTSKKL